MYLLSIHYIVKEVVAQCLIILIAGYDTTAHTLSYALYLLATNQDIQEKAYQDVISHVFTDDDDVWCRRCCCLCFAATLITQCQYFNTVLNGRAIIDEVSGIGGKRDSSTISTWSRVGVKMCLRSML